MNGVAYSPYQTQMPVPGYYFSVLRKQPGDIKGPSGSDWRSKIGFWSHIFAECFVVTLKAEKGELRSDNMRATYLLRSKCRDHLYAWRELFTHHHSIFQFQSFPGIYDDPDVGRGNIQVKSATSRLGDIQLGDKSSRRHPTRRQQRSTRRQLRSTRRHLLTDSATTSVISATTFLVESGPT